MAIRLLIKGRFGFRRLTVSQPLWRTAPTSLFSIREPFEGQDRLIQTISFRFEFGDHLLKIHGGVVSLYPSMTQDNLPVGK